ncbi:DNA helicase, partial [Tanacetum coccineum]
MGKKKFHLRDSLLNQCEKQIPNIVPTTQNSFIREGFHNGSAKYDALCNVRSGQSDLHPSVMASQGILRFVEEIQTEIVLKLSEDAQLYLDVFQRYSRYSVGKQKVHCSASSIGGIGSGKQKSTLHQTVSDVGCRVSRPVSAGSPFRNTQDAVVGGFPLPNYRKRITADLHLTPVPSATTTSKTSRYFGCLDQPLSTRPCLDYEPCSNQPFSTRSRVNTSNSIMHTGSTYAYLDLGDCNQHCHHCGASFWYRERLKGRLYNQRPEYHLCCGGGQIYMQPERDPPDYIKNLLQNKHFMEKIRAYNQMFAMTSFGANIDESVNAGRGPYVFKVSGQIYHWIGSLCPPVGEAPRFLQLYIYDTDNEVKNRMRHFGGADNSYLDTQIVEGLIQILDAHNELIQLFRTARDKCREMDIPDFKIRLYNAEGARGYELPTSNTLGAMVFENGITTNKEFDVIIEHKDGPPQRINKLHRSYMSLQFPLLFIYGQPGYHTELKLRSADSDGRPKRMTMLAYYSYQLHFRLKQYDLIFRGGRLFQQYVVSVFCTIEQNRLDFIRKNQNNIRSDHLSGLYDALSRGERDGYEVGGRIILPMSFTGGPRYMYAHYLDALAICRKLGNPQFFITFTCNVNCPEIKRFMAEY